MSLIDIVPKIQNYLIIGGICAVAGLFCGYKVCDWKHASDKLKVADKVVVQQKQTNTTNQNAANITNDTSGEVAAQTAKRNQDEIVRIQFRDKYVTVHDNAQCMPDYGTVLLLNSSISGDVSSLSDPAEQSRSKEPSGVTLDRTIDTLQYDLNVCHQAIDNYEKLWDWNLKQKANADAGAKAK